MAKKDDLLWKGILEEIFDDFLRFMHPEADEIYDLKKGIAFLDKELEQLFPPEEDEFSPKVVDKLARVNTREGKEEWVLIHVEVQGRYQKDFPKGCLLIITGYWTNITNVSAPMPFLRTDTR
ncbi:hypothetical protein QT327_02250 [Olivibacter sp. 47]|uniref:hypothetical protein n=1 Tax=Olivibacter sp. 47 TaxID=3056486 RepID=UPI0025A362FB|nr:hypothetical protein [Olivibacter sp. 47]MDM8173183.1 hypothetical protein [Olivibacter sp. 47]